MANSSLTVPTENPLWAGLGRKDERKELKPKCFPVPVIPVLLQLPPPRPRGGPPEWATRRGEARQRVQEGRV